MKQMALEARLLTINILKANLSVLTVKINVVYDVYVEERMLLKTSGKS